MFSVCVDDNHANGVISIPNDAADTAARRRRKQIAARAAAPPKPTDVLLLTFQKPFRVEFGKARAGGPPVSRVVRLKYPIDQAEYGEATVRIGDRFPTAKGFTASLAAEQLMARVTASTMTTPWTYEVRM